MGGFGLASWMYYWLDGKAAAAVGADRRRILNQAT
jgi:hypothetical protein